MSRLYSFTRIIIATITSLLNFSSAIAGEVPAITLQPFAGEETVRVVSTKNIYGTCGQQVVAIVGIKSENFSGYGDFSIDASGNSDVIIRDSNKETSFKSLLSDINSVHCIKTNSGYRLIIASHCGGSKCSDAFDFHIIDPLSQRIIAPAIGQICDAKCASLVLKSRAPFKIEGLEK